MSNDQIIINNLSKIYDNGFNALKNINLNIKKGEILAMLGPNGGADIMKTPRSKWGLLPRASEFLLTTLSEQENAGELTYNVKASFLKIG